MILNNNNETLNILHWNANGITSYSKIRQLENLLSSKNIHIAGLNETFFKEMHKPFFYNYTIHRNDRLNGNGGGVALLVRKDINHRVLPALNTRYVENLSIEIFINNKRVQITTAYSPRFHQSFSNDIKMLAPNNNEFILLGDLNAKHHSWNCSYNNSAGNALFNLQLLQNFFVYFPTDPTLYPHQQNCIPSTVDIALSNLSNPLRITALDYEMTSDHRPVLCSISGRLRQDHSPTFVHKYTNWNTFQDVVNRGINISMRNYGSISLIDKEIQKFTQLILLARNIATPTNTETKSFTLPQNILRLIGQRRKVKRKEIRSNNFSQRSFYKQWCKFLSRRIDEKINAIRNKEWSNLLENMRPGDKRFWKVSRSLRCKGKKNIPHLTNGNIRFISDSEKAEQLARVFHNSHELTLSYYHSIDQEVNRTVTALKAEPPCQEDIIPISSEEVLSILIRLKSSKAPGFDGITNKILKKLPTKAVELLVLLFNSCMRLNYFPKVFKKAKVVAIPKLNKPPNNPSSYRPISLLSCLGKVFEKLIHERINDFAEEANVISENQFGFKRGHSTIHQVGRIKNKIINHKRNRRSTGLILLDIEKAFDTVWHNGLLYKLLSANTPKYLCKIVAEYLENREFIVVVNNSPSDPKPIPAGLPQGSILSPTLYSIYTSDFKPPSIVDTAYYADDTALITSSKLTGALLKKMELSLKSCNKYFRKWKIKINNNKTQAIIFPFNKSPKRLPLRQIQFDASEIRIVNKVTYLGVTLDKKLTFGDHISISCQKAIKAFRSLWPFLNRRSTLSLKNKNLIYKGVIRPILTYASPVWSCAAISHLKKLQIVQNKCLKMIYKKHWRFPTRVLHDESGYDLIINFINRINENYTNRTLASHNRRLQDSIVIN